MYAGTFSPKNGSPNNLKEGFEIGPGKCEHPEPLEVGTPGRI